MSLIKQLEGLIQEKGYVAFDEIEVMAKYWGYKISNAERRLRESPNVLPEYNEKRYIKGYRWVGGVVPDNRSDAERVAEILTQRAKNTKLINSLF